MQHLPAGMPLDAELGLAPPSAGDLEAGGRAQQPATATATHQGALQIPERPRPTTQPPSGATRLQPPRFEPAERSPAPQPQPADDAAGSAAAAVVSLTSTAVLSKRLAAAAVGLPLGALITPLPSDGPAPPLVQRPPVTCAACGGFLNPYCKVQPHSHSWRCLFCNHANDAIGALLTDDPRECLELQSEVADFLQQRVGGTGSAAAPQPPTVLAVDATGDADDLERLKGALLEVVRALPPETRLVLLSFGAALSVWRLNPALAATAGGAAAADAISGSSELAEADLQRLLGGLPRYSAHLGTARPAVEAATRALRPQRQQQAARQRPRALGAALEAALFLARGPAAADASKPGAPGMGGRPAPRGRVLLIATGPATKGPGTVALDAIDGGDDGAFTEAAARKYFQWLAGTAAAAGVSVDVFAVGSSAANVAALAPVAERSGGLLVLHEGFGPLFGAGIVAALSRRAGSNGGLDLKTSPGLSVSQIIGPVVPLEGAGSGSSPARPHMRQLNGVERGRGLAVILDVHRDLSDEFVFFQVILGWLTDEGHIHERVVTRRIRATLSPSVYLSSVDADAVALLLAKRIVLEAAHTGATRDKAVALQLRTAIGRHIYHVAVKLGQAHEEGDAGWFSVPKRTWALPPQLTPIAQAMYHLQRGPVLGGAAGHVDERTANATLLLNAAPPLAARMLQPAAYLFDDEAGAFQPVEPVDLALVSGRPVVLDHGAAIFVLLGGQADAVVSQAHRFAEGLASGRLPLPDVRFIDVASPDARYIATRLAPTQHDLGIDRAAFYPRTAAAAMAASSRSVPADRLPPSEELSLLQWAAHFRVRLSAVADVDAAAAALARLQLPQRSG